MIRTRRYGAFTLIELLVAIVIIIILVSITIPVVSKVRQSAYAASTGALVNSLTAAIQQYQQQFSAYPGPLSNDQLGPTPPVAVPATLAGGTQQVTGAENLVLGLLGGLRYDTTTGLVVYDWSIVGQGPRSLSPRLPQKKAALMEPSDLSWTDGQPSTGVNEPGPESGLFADEITPARATPAGAVDSVVPEFVDRFPNPLPVLYLRARVGANGVIGFRAGAQYDIADILAYTDPNGQPDPAIPPTGSSIGMGKKLDGYYVASATPQPDPTPYHGLRTIDPAPGSGTARNMNTPGPNYYYPADAFPYFLNPSVPNTPRQKDAFILISAGKDRVYGTEDDITNFGPVMVSK